MNLIQRRWTMAKKAIIYTRVSTHDQAETGYSLDDQEAIKQFWMMGWYFLRNKKSSTLVFPKRGLGAQTIELCFCPSTPSL